MIITHQTEGLLPLPDKFVGRIVALRASALGKRYQLARFQLWRASGGFGCESGKIGTKVYAECLADGEEGQWRRGDFIGEASVELIKVALADDTPVPQFDPTDTCLLGIGHGGWVFGDDEQAVRYKIKRNGLKKLIALYRVHRESQVTEFGSILSPKGAAAPVLVLVSQKGPRA